jgi:DNA polymerase III alpha subunit
MIPLFKSSRSLLRSILTLDINEKEADPDLPDSIFDLAKEGELKTVVLVEDTIGSFLQANLASKKAGVKLVFGYRVSFISDASDKTDAGFQSSYKNIIFPKNYDGYKRLIKLATIAGYDNFYKEARLDYQNLRDYWSDSDLALAIPFYDSFLHKNLLGNGLCIPEYGDIKPTVFIESNELPFDYLLEEAALDFAAKNGLDVQRTKSIYYKKRDDFEAYLTLKCLNRKQFGSGRTLADPGFEHMSSREFSWESYLDNRNV